VFGVLRAADKSKRIGIRPVTLIEFGVASIMNMAYIAERVTRERGVASTGMGSTPGRACHRRRIIATTPSGIKLATLRAALHGSVHLVLGDLREIR